MTLTVVDRDGNDVRRIATAVPADPDQPLRATWDGTGSDGRRAPDGRYLLRANLRKLGRAVTLHPGVYLDTSAPKPTVFAGGAAGRWITGPVAKPVQYRVRGVSSRRPTQVTVLRTDGGPPREVASYVLPRGVRRGVWDGKANGAAAPPGTYLIAAAVRDTAGNVGRSAPVEPEPGTIGGRPGVSVRRLLARPPVDPVRTGQRARFAVDSRGRPYTWNIRRVGADRPVRRGRARTGGDLSVELPTGRAGLYLLAVRAGSDFTRVPFAVQDSEPAPILVVLPGITWFGRDQLDDDRDGLPNTLDNGGPADYPRLLASGLPQGFTAQVAPMLAFLDRQRIGYDVTTDLTLAATRRGLSEERAGVLLPGPLRWVPTGLAGRLRRYVDRWRPAGDVRRRLAAARRRRRSQPAPAAAAAHRRRSVRDHPAPAAPAAGRRRSAAADRRRGQHRAADRRAVAVGLHRGRGVRRPREGAVGDRRGRHGRPGHARRRPARPCRRATRRWRCRASGRAP